MKRIKTVGDIVLQSFGGAKKNSKFLTSLSTEEYAGYVTAMIVTQNPSLREGPDAIIAIVRDIIRVL